MTWNRVIRPAGGAGMCRCGLRRAYEVTLKYKRKDRFGLLVEQTRLHSYCSTHGRIYAAKFNLTIQPEGERKDATGPDLQDRQTPDTQ